MSTYCKECGHLMKIFEVLVSDIEVLRYDSGGRTRLVLSSPYNPKTGERNVATVYQCPNYKRRWYGGNHHDIFCDYENEIFWCIRIKKS